MPRYATGLILCLLISLIGCLESTYDVKAPLVLPPSAVLSVKPERMREALLSEYRLMPDSRFRLGLAHILDINQNSVTASFDGSGWTLEAGSTLGTVSKFPEFSELYGILLSAAPAGSGSEKISGDLPAAPELDSFYSPFLFEALRKIDPLPNDPVVLAQKARILARIVLQQLDSTAVADDLPAQALAALAIAESAGANLKKERCILMWSLDYTREADLCAQNLDANDPFRLFVKGDPKLAELAGQDEASNEVHFLYLSKLAHYRRNQEWAEHLNSRKWIPEANFAILSSGITLEKFEWNIGLLKMAQIASITEARKLDQEIGVVNRVIAWIRGSRKPEVRAEVDYAMELLHQQSTNAPLFSANRILGQFAESFLLAAYTQEALHYLDKYGHGGISRNYSEKFTTFTAGHIPHYLMWYDHLIRSDQAETNIRPLMHDIVSNSLGLKALKRTFKEIKHRLPYYDPRSPAAVRELFKRLDTRPQSLEIAASAANTQLKDPRLTEVLYGASTKHNPLLSRRTAVWWADVAKDAPRLEEYLRDPRFHDRYAYIVEALLRVGASSTSLSDSLRQVMQENPKEWAPVDKYVTYLKEQGRVQEARAVLDEWLDDHTAADGFDYIHPMNSMGRLYQLEGNLDMALEYALGVTNSWQAGAMQLAASILNDLNRYDEAEFYYRRTHRRYPQSAVSMSYLTQFLWYQNRVTEGTRIALEWEADYGTESWNKQLESRFAEMASKLSADKLSEIFLTLSPQIEFTNLLNLAMAVSRAGYPEKAIEMLQVLPNAGYDNDILKHAMTYFFVKRAYGKEEAEKWIIGNVGEQRNRASMGFYYMEAYDLLWILIPNPEKDHSPESVWLMRALAYPHYDEASPERVALDQYYEGNRADRYYKFGKFIMNKADASSIWPLADTGRHRCEVAYYIGMKHLLEGRTATAVDWFRVARETNSTRDGEWRWALDRITDVRGAGITANFDIRQLLRYR